MKLFKTTIRSYSVFYVVYKGYIDEYEPNFELYHFSNNLSFIFTDAKYSCKIARQLSRNYDAVTVKVHHC